MTLKRNEMGAAGQTTVALLLRGSKLYIRGMARNAPSSLERGRFGLILIRVGPGPESGHSRPDPIPENPPNQSTSNNRIRHGQRLHGKGLLICLVDWCKQASSLPIELARDLSDRNCSAAWDTRYVAGSSTNSSLPSRHPLLFI